MIKYKQIFYQFFLLILGCFCIYLSFAEISDSKVSHQNSHKNNTLTITESHHYKNLSIYLVKGEDILGDMRILTLSEALS